MDIGLARRYLLLVLMSSSLALLSGKRESVHVIGPGEAVSELRFIKNKGQWDERIKFLARLTYGNILFENSGITYVFEAPSFEKARHPDSQIEANPIKKHVLKLTYIGAQSHPNIVPQEPYAEYHNYFYGTEPSRWASGVRVFRNLRYKDLYPNIDLRYYGLANSLKYDFLVHPGASPDAISLVYEGADSLYLENGSLHIVSSLGRMEELPPLCYQYSGDHKRKIRSGYSLSGDTVRIQLEEDYDPNALLVIDPELEFSTFIGSTADNWGFTATYDSKGNAYAGGIQYRSNSFAKYPTTIGAFQEEFGGGMSDVTLAKFSPDGSSLLFSTFMGGDSADQPHSLIVNEKDELYVLGRTKSPDFPVASDAFDTQKTGIGYDMFVSKLSADGKELLASTYVGGRFNDGVNGSSDYAKYTNLKFNYGDDSRGEIILDSEGRPIIASCTNSPDFPVSPSAFQSSFGGKQDACIVKFDENLRQILWGTYLGGEGDDAAYGLKIGRNNNIYLCGGTESADFPVSANSLKSFYQGGSADGFISNISSDGRLLLNSTYLGTEDYDQGYLLEIDSQGEVYVFGQTKGNIPLVDSKSGPVYYNPGAKQFVQKLNPSLDSLRFSTVFGSRFATGPNISPTAFLVDKCGNIYVAGWGGKTNNHTGGPGGFTRDMPLSPSAFQTTTDGSDFYLGVFSKEAQELLYGSYFGGNNPGSTSGEHVDGGTSRFDRNGVVYHAVCADCGGFNSFPTSPNAYSNTNQSDNCNLAIFKLAFEFGGIESNFATLDSSRLPLEEAKGCSPFTVNFQNTSKFTTQQTSYQWQFGDASPGSSEFEPQHIFTQAGTYTVRLIAIDSSQCNIADTSFQTIEVVAPPMANAGDDQLICRGDTADFQASGGDSFEWTSAISLSNPLISNPKAFPEVSTTYTLTVRDSLGCRATDEIEVMVDPGPTLSLGDALTVCQDEPVPISISSVNASVFQWEPAHLFEDPSLQNPLLKGLSDTVQVYVLASSSNGCKAMDSLVINVFSINITSPSSEGICPGDSIQLQALGPANTYAWSPSNSVSDPSSQNSFVFPSQTTIYKLQATNDIGCGSEQEFLLEVYPAPQANAGEDQEICLGQTTELEGGGGITYNWSPASGVNGPSMQNPQVFPLQDTEYYLNITDANNCRASDTVKVTVHPLPAVLANGEGEICFGDAQQLAAIGAQNYLWNPSLGLSQTNIANPIASPGQSILYTVTGTNEFGCENQDSVRLTVLPQAMAEISGSDISCPGTEITLTARGGDSYIWDNGETGNIRKDNPLSNTTYSVTAFNGACEGTTAEFEINVAETFPIAQFFPSSTFGYAPFSINFTNNSQFASAYKWNFGDKSPINEEVDPHHVFVAPGEYTISLVAFSNEGCADTFQLEIEVDPVSLHVPSGFSPNLDGINDEFYLGYEGIENLEIKIFNRWGQLLFHSTDKDFKWDGRYKGVSVQEGVYVYRIEGTGKNNVAYNKAGTLTLIR